MSREIVKRIHDQMDTDTKDFQDEYWKKMERKMRNNQVGYDKMFDTRLKKYCPYVPGRLCRLQNCDVCPVAQRNQGIDLSRR